MNYYYNQNGFAFVNGIEDAKAYIVGPNCTYFLRDTNSNMCFEKRADSSGKWTMKVYNLVEVQPDEPIKRSEFDALSAKIDTIMAMLKGGSDA